MSAAQKPTVFLVDDDADVRNAIRLLFKSEGIPLVPHATGKDALKAIGDKPVGCVLLDLRMAEMDGLEFQKELLARKLPIPVILLTGHATVPVAVQAVKAGALDVIQKPFKDEDLIEAVKHALEVHAQWQQSLQERHAAAERIAELTPREIQVLDLMVSGMRNKDIAEQLGISPKTLDIHRANVMDKMEARTTADLVRARLLERADPMALPYIFGMR